VQGAPADLTTRRVAIIGGASTAVSAPAAGSTAVVAQVEVPGLVENTWKGMTMEDAPGLALNVAFRVKPLAEKASSIFPFA
jgi:hypothetical protein